MSNIHRVLWIDEQLRNKRYPDRCRIADKFEISIRQVARDIDYMRDTLGAPIEYSSFKKGYYYKEEDTYVLPHHYLTTKERTILDELSKQYRAYGGSQSAKIANLLQRLSWVKSNDIEDLFGLEKEDNTYPSHRTPFVAIVSVNQEPLGLKHLYEKIENNVYKIKFYESKKLLTDLLGCCEYFKIVKPSWLQEKLENRLKKLLK